MKTGHSLLAVAVCLALVLPGSAQEGTPIASEGGAEAEILFSEDFDDPDRGQMPRASPSPSNYLVSYADGGYRIERINADFAGLPNAPIPGSFGDASISVEAQIEGDLEGRWVYVNCRVQSRPFGGYYLSVYPANGTFVLGRWDNSPDGPGGTTFASGSSPAIQTDNAPNRLELSCAGPRIWASVNGQIVGSVEDSTFSEGRLWLAVWGNGVTASAFFDNLSVARADVASAPPLVGAPGPPPAPSQRAPQQPGSILLAENFDNPASGRLPPSSPDPAHYVRGYVNSEYQLKKVDPEWPFTAFASLTGTFTDASLAVDVRLVGETPSQYLLLTCRAQGSSSYRLSLNPGTRQLLLSRVDQGQLVTLADWRPAAAIRRLRSTNRVELTCSGGNIWASVNGVPVVSATDGTYDAGEFRFAAYASNDTVDARFDNLVVTQRDPAEPPPTLPGPPKPGDVLLADNFDHPAAGWLPLSHPVHELGYQDGKYLMRRLNPNSVPRAWLPGAFGDVSIEVDAALGGGFGWLTIRCGYQQGSGYRVEFNDSGDFHIVKTEGERSAVLARGRALSVRGAAGTSHRFGITCTRSGLLARAEGSVVGSVADVGYAGGAAGIGLLQSQRGEPVSAILDNLVVTQR